jgi:protein translocase SecG subunit
MNILFGVLTVIMFLDCVVLMFLVLLQLPKKEAGAGMAFGGAATDALFGAGSGTALTALTQYSAGIFFGLALIMAIMTAHRDKGGANSLTDALLKGDAAAGHIVSQPASTPATGPASAGSNFLQSTPPPTATNSSAPAADTNTVSPPASTLPSLEMGTNK